jgi:hypothetical protein
MWRPASPSNATLPLVAAVNQGAGSPTLRGEIVTTLFLSLDYVRERSRRILAFDSTLF